MKKCQPCGALCPANAPHCARCGEASWIAAPALPVPAEPEPVEPAFVYDVYPPPPEVAEMPAITVEVLAPVEPPPAADIVEYKGRGLLTPEEAAPFENALPWPPVAADPVLVGPVDQEPPHVAVDSVPVEVGDMVVLSSEDASPPNAPPIVIESPGQHVAAPEPVQAPVLVPSAPKSPAPAKHRKRDR